MAVEIRELVIKAVVTHSSQRTGSNGTAREYGDEECCCKKFEETTEQLLELLNEDKNER